MEGALLVNKPTGWTSFDVVNYVRKHVAAAEGKKPKHVKVGHTGTLDPFATGLLILLVGKSYTRRASELSSLDKTYDVTMQLGVSSSTGDPEGELQTLTDAPHPSRDIFRSTLMSFMGEGMQTPPSFSAIKVNGQRAYKLARQGTAVTLEPRAITIRQLELSEYAYPAAHFCVEVSSGTYIRSLVEDIAHALGTTGYTTALCRTTVGHYTLAQAIDVAQLDATSIAAHLITLSAGAE